MRRCPAAREAGYREIEAPPEEMDWTDLAQKACAKHSEYSIGLNQNPPETVGKLGVIGGMPVIFLEPGRVLDLARHGPDRHLKAERVHSIHQRGIKIGNRPRPQRKPLTPAVIGADLQRMLDKI